MTNKSELIFTVSSSFKVKVGKYIIGKKSVQNDSPLKRSRPLLAKIVRIFYFNFFFYLFFNICLLYLIIGTIKAFYIALFISREVLAEEVRQRSNLEKNLLVHNNIRRVYKHMVKVKFRKFPGFCDSNLTLRKAVPPSSRWMRFIFQLKSMARVSMARNGG